jgi:hypothetical protein
MSFIGTLVHFQYARTETKFIRVLYHGSPKVNKGVAGKSDSSQ